MPPGLSMKKKGLSMRDEKSFEERFKEHFGEQVAATPAAKAFLTTYLNNLERTYEERVSALASAHERAIEEIRAPDVERHRRRIFRLIEVASAGFAVMLCLALARAAWTQDMGMFWSSVVGFFMLAIYLAVSLR